MSERTIEDDNQEKRRRIAQGIIHDAENEARKIISDAEQAKKDRISAAEAQAERIQTEAERKADETMASIQTQTESTIAVEGRRRELKSREMFLRQAKELAARKMAALIGQDGYRDILRNWIMEAAAGLNAASAVVNASSAEREMIDEDLLEKAAQAAQEISGQSTTLQLSQEHPLPEQGVVLTAADGRTSFDNRVSTRMLRHMSEIRKIVYEGLTSE